jgi:hypothetical protein
MNSDSGGYRWWENYLVRYFLPSVAGMVIVRWLEINSGNGLTSYLPMFLLDDWKDFGTAHLIVWLLFGSLYCYIASYPILVFHATRVLDFKDVQGNITNWKINPYLATLLFAVFTYVAAWINSLSLIFVAFITFSILQLLRLYKIYKTQKLFGFNKGFDSSLAYAYLNKLSKRRGIIEEFESSENEDDGSKTSIKASPKKDLAESYKHMREHGNTAFIFLLELSLCPAFLLAIQHQKGYLDFSFLSILLIIWVLPSAMVHFLGQHLERRYSLFRH